MNVKKIFGKRLTQAMDEKGIGGAELGRRINVVTRGAVSNWRNGENLPDAIKLREIAKILEVSTDWLLGLSNENTFSDRGQTLELQDSETLARLVAEEHEYEGLRWLEYIPPYIDSEIQEEIEIGISIFRELIENNLTFTEAVKKVGVEEGIAMAGRRRAIQTNAIHILAVPRDEQVEEELKARFRLKNIFVVKDFSQFQSSLTQAELVAFLAAKEVLSCLEAPRAIGIGAGYTVARAIQLSIPKSNYIHQTKCLPLYTFSANPDGYLTANQNANLLATKYPNATVYKLPFVNLPARNRITRSLAKPQNVVKAILGELVSADAILISANGWGRKLRNQETMNEQIQFRAADPDIRLSPNYMESLYAQLSKAEQENCSGEIVGFLIDKEGKPINMRETNKSVLSLGLEALKSRVEASASVWIIGARAYKATMIYTALIHKFANSLVIDYEIAQELKKLGATS